MAVVGLWLVKAVGISKGARLGPEALVALGCTVSCGECGVVVMRLLGWDGLEVGASTEIFRVT